MLFSFLRHLVSLLSILGATVMIDHRTIDLRVDWILYLLQADSTGNLETTLLAIDASPFYDTSDDQYRDGYLQRDLNKAFIGFLPSRETDMESVDDEQSDEDISFYTVTTEKSYLTTTDTDFETASESLDVPTKMEAGDSKGKVSETGNFMYYPSENFNVCWKYMVSLKT